MGVMVMKFLFLWGRDKPNIRRETYLIRVEVQQLSPVNGNVPMVNGKDKIEGSRGAI